MGERALLVGGPRHGMVVETRPGAYTIVTIDPSPLTWDYGEGDIAPVYVTYQRLPNVTYLGSALIVFGVAGAAISTDLILDAMAVKPPWLNEWATDMMNRSHRDITH